MNTYLLNKKIEFIKQSRDALKAEYNIDYTPFTRKLFFYFFVLDNKKFVYKEALRFIYSNAETYTRELEPTYCDLQPQYEPVDVCSFLESYSNKLIPKLIDTTDSFFIFDYVQGEPINFVTQEEFGFIEEENKKMPLTPFYNSMTYNLVRTTSNSINLVDLKHFECKIDLPFFLYFYNKEHSINRLFVRKNTDLTNIVKHIGIDYPINETEIILY